MSNEKILVIGANGQIGVVLAEALRKLEGVTHVLTSDIRVPKKKDEDFMILDVLNQKALAEVVNANGITQIYHLAAILSAKGEKEPLRTWKINMDGLFNVLEVARTSTVTKVFFPSSIGVFGKDFQKTMTPQQSVLTPETVYGISKVAGELWCNYYYDKYGVDVRSVRFPGVIGHQSMPGGGTTDYAVEIFHEALKTGHYNCFLSKDTMLPMIYMPDAIKAIIQLMGAPKENLTIHSSYNLAGFSFTPQQIADAIRKVIPGFSISYQPDFRQAIADSWPNSLDDSAARNDWGWQPDFDLDAMVLDMLTKLKKKMISGSFTALNMN